MPLRRVYLFYWIFTVLTIILLGSLSWLSVQPLEGSQPQKALAKYQQYNTILEYATPMAFIVLLLAASYLYYKGLSSFYLWVSLAVFIAFTLVDYMVVKDAFFAYKDEQGMKAAGAAIGKMLGGIMILMGALVAGVDYFILTNLHRRQAYQRFAQSSDQGPTRNKS